MGRLTVLKQIAADLASQFGPDCEVVIHDLKTSEPEHSIVYIVNGHVTNRDIGDGLLTLIPVGLISLLIYIAVVSPSRLELVAMITSFTSSFARRCMSSFSLISSGPIPSIGEIAP